MAVQFSVTKKNINFPLFKEQFNLTYYISIHFIPPPA